MPTMADVAKRAGVAASTVSYVLSGNRPVSEAVRQRVLRAIAELDYQPHALARGLASRHSRIIALVYPLWADELLEVQFEFVRGAVGAAAHHGYNLLLSTPLDDGAEVCRLIRQGLVEGLVLMDIRLRDSRVEMLREHGFPFCMIGRCERNEGLSFVDHDLEQAISLCVSHLADLGHRHIALLNYSASLLEAGFTPAVHAQSSFERAMRSRGLHCEVCLCEAGPERGRQAMESLLAECPALSAAIMVDTGGMPGVHQALHEHGLHIPGDFSLVAVTSARMAERSLPPLTTADLPAVEMGRVGAETLIRRLEGQKEPSQLLLPPRLTIRGSSGPDRRGSRGRAGAQKAARAAG